MNPYYDSRSSRPARLFSFGLLDVQLQVRLRRPHLREATAAIGLSSLATACMNNWDSWQWQTLSGLLYD